MKLLKTQMLLKISLINLNQTKTCLTKTRIKSSTMNSELTRKTSMMHKQEQELDLTTLIICLTSKLIQETKILQRREIIQINISLTQQVEIRKLRKKLKQHLSKKDLIQRIHKRKVLVRNKLKKIQVNNWLRSNLLKKRSTISHKKFLSLVVKIQLE